MLGFMWNFFRFPQFIEYVLRRDYLSRIMELQKKYSSLPMDFADATLIIVAESLHINKIFSTDKDFLIYRIPGRKHFKNLME